MTTRAARRDPGWRSWSDEMAGANHLVRPLIEDWLMTYRVGEASPSTLRTYRILVTGFLNWFEGTDGFDRELRCRDMGDGENGHGLVLKYLDRRRKEKKSPATQKTTLAALRQFSAWLRQQGYTRADTVGQLKHVRQPKRLIDIFTGEEKDRIRRYFLSLPEREGARYLTLFLFLLDTGVRRSEAASLRLDQLRLRDSRGALLPGGEATVIGKGNKERQVGIGRQTVVVLDRYLREHRPTPITEGDEPFVFLNFGGRWWDPDAITLLFARWSRTLGIPHLHPHACRHTFATDFLRAGGDVVRLMILLGHASLQQTMHYVHLVEGDDIIRHHHAASPVDAWLAPKRLPSHRTLTPHDLTVHRRTVGR